MNGPKQQPPTDLVLEALLRSNRRLDGGRASIGSDADVAQLRTANDGERCSWCGRPPTRTDAPPVHRGCPVVAVPRFHGSGMKLVPSFATGVVAAGASA
eukprot:201416-Prymnesium_polylepis.2